MEPNHNLNSYIHTYNLTYFGSLDRNEKGKCIKGTTKCSQYDVTMINEL